MHRIGMRCAHEQVVTGTARIARADHMNGDTLKRAGYRLVFRQLALRRTTDAGHRSARRCPIHAEQCVLARNVLESREERRH